METHGRVRGSTRDLAIVLATGLVATAVKLLIAARTYGTDDVRYWTAFARGVAAHGPLQVYGVPFPEAPYNHPPLATWWLVAVDRLSPSLEALPFLIRLPACLADLVTALLIYSLVRRRVGQRPAMRASLLFSATPLAFVISGFHGNTDPVFVMLLLTSVWLSTARARPLAAGIAFGVALSVKIVPVVALPMLVMLVARHGRAAVLRFLLGGGVVFAVLWLPVLAANGESFLSEVLLYNGIGPRQWGFSGVLRLAGVPFPTVVGLGDAVRFPLLMTAAFLPMWLVRARGMNPECMALVTLPLFLAVSPAMSMQYLVWGLAPLLAAAPLLTASAYAVSSSIFALVVYSGWNGAWPWNWYEARSTPLPDVLWPLMALAWVALARGCWKVTLPVVAAAPPELHPTRLESA